MLGVMSLKLEKIKEILGAKVLVGHQFLDREVTAAFGSDLMSDVLSYVNENTVLLTGLTNSQVIRAAEITDLAVIIFVKRKNPSKEIIDMARNNNIIVMLTECTLYTACGRLYENGLRGIDIERNIG